MFCSFYLILYIIWFQFSLSLSPFYYFDYYEHQYFTSILFHMFSFIKNALFGSYSWMSHRTFIESSAVTTAFWLDQYGGRFASIFRRCPPSMFWGQWRLPVSSVPGKREQLSIKMVFRDRSQTLVSGGAWCKKKYSDIFSGPLRTLKNSGLPPFLPWKFRVNTIEEHVNSIFTGKFVVFSCFSRRVSRPPLQGSKILTLECQGIGHSR